MATFTNEEIDFLKKRGNEYCQKIWLGLYEGTPLATVTSDEIANRDFMVEKYERRRFYLDPSKADVISARSTIIDNHKSEPKPVKVNGLQVQSTFRTRPEVVRNNNNASNNLSTFANFDKADIFSSSNGNTTVNGNNLTQQNGFANFDSNPVFSNNTTTTTTTTTGMPPTTTLNNVNGWNYNPNNSTLNGSQSSTFNGTLNGSQNGFLNGPAPVEDKYAALKDLDNELKSQKNMDWSSASSNGSLYSSPTPTRSVSSPSPQNSMFGSPSQGYFMSAFSAGQENGTANLSNPFSNGGVNWGNINGVNGFNGQQQPQQQPFANPFANMPKMNGFSQGFQSNAFPINSTPSANGTNAWTPNPFKVGATTNSTSNNPFL